VKSFTDNREAAEEFADEQNEAETGEDAEPMTTKEILVSMLTDSVGTSFLDSGGTPKFDENGKYVGSSGGYGRHVERNRGRDFDKELSSAVRFSVRDGKLEIEMEHNVYHWLARRIDIHTKLDAIFHGAFLKVVDADDDKHWFELMEEFPAWVAENVATDDYRVLGDGEDEDLTCEVGGLYNEGKPLVVNSYNGEDLLSQVIQYVYFTWDNQEYVVLQIHGGADVRGGYSTPHVFECGRDLDETAIFDNAKGSVYCTGKDHHPAALRLKAFQETQPALPGVKIETIDFDDCRANWYTNDGCNFYDDGCCGRNHTNLEDMDCVDLEAEIDEAEGKEPEEGSVKPGDWRPGVVYVLDHKAYCPKCGALLAASD